MRRAKYTVFSAALLLALGLETQAMAREVIFTGEDCPLTVITDLSAYLNRPKAEEREVVYRTVAAQSSSGQAGTDLSEAYEMEPEETAASEPASDQSDAEQAQPEEGTTEQPAAAGEAKSAEAAADEAQPEETAAGQAQSGEVVSDEAVPGEELPDEAAVSDEDQPEEAASGQAQTASGQADAAASDEGVPETEEDVFRPQTFVSDGVLMTLPSEEVTLSSFDALGIIDDTYVMITYDGGKVGYLSTDEIDVKVPDMNGRLMRELPSVSGWTTLKQGSDGELVSQAQQALANLDFLEGEVDGLYGSGTAGSVQRFQESAGLPATGEIDTVTWLRILRAGDPALSEVKPLETDYPPVYEARKKFYLIYNDVADPDYLDQFLDPEWKITYNVFDGEGKIDYTRNGIDLGTVDVGNRQIDKMRLSACMYVNLKRIDTGAVRPMPVLEIRAEGTHLPYINGATLKYGIYSEDFVMQERDAALQGMNSTETAIMEVNWDIYKMIGVELGGGELILQVHGEERDFEMDLTPHLHEIQMFTDTCFNLDTEGLAVEEEEEEEEEDFYTEEEPTSETEMADDQVFAIETPDTVTEEADASAVFNTSTSDETSESGEDDVDEAAAQASPAPEAFQDDMLDNEPETASAADEPAPEDAWISQEADDEVSAEPETPAAEAEAAAAEEAGTAE